MGSRATQPNRRFGAWLARANNTVYQAATDGEVDAYGLNIVEGLTDGANPPVTTRQLQSRTAPDEAALTMSVRKGDYWKVTGCTVIFWIPTEP